MLFRSLDHLLGVDVLLFTAATLPFVVFYWSAGETRARARKGRLRGVLRTLALGIGLSVPVSRAVLRGLRRASDPFERTPKRGDRHRDRYAAVRVPIDTALKGLMIVLMSTYLVAAVAGGFWGQIPFIVLFLSGYVVLGVPALGRAIADAPSRPGVVDEHGEEWQPEGGTDDARLRPLTGVLVTPESEIADECEAA